MEPPIKDGTLVLLRSSDSYQVGDIVAFQNGDGNLILHRIVGREGDLFVMRGDNNSADDAYRPAVSDIVGELWLQIPGVGSVVGGSLLFWALIAAVVMGLALAAVRRTVRLTPGGTLLSNRALAPQALPTIQVAATALVALLVASGIVLGLVSFTRSQRTEQVETLTYMHEGELQYSARSDPALYPDGVATSGDPVYRRYADSVEMTFNYNLNISDPLSSITGTGQVDLILRAPDGWTSAIEVSPLTPVEGTRMSMSSDLSFAQVDERIAELEESAGLPPDYYDTYELSLVASVTVHGFAGASAVDEEFIAVFDFLIDDYVFEIHPERQALGEDALATQVPGATNIVEEVNNQVELGVLRLDVDTARSVSLALIAAGLAAAATMLLAGLLQNRVSRSVANATPEGHVEQVNNQSAPRHPGQRHAARLTTIRPRNRAVEVVASGSTDRDGLANSLERISTQLDDHDRNVGARFDEVLEELDHFRTELHLHSDNGSRAGVEPRPARNKPATLRPIRLRTRAERREASQHSEDDPPAESRMSGR